MRIKHFTPSVPIFPEIEFEVDKPICFLCGGASSVYMNLIRSFVLDKIGHDGPVSPDDADFGTSAQMELDGKVYELHYLLERDDSYSFAALSPTDTVGVLHNDTEEVRAKMRKRGLFRNNVFDGLSSRNGRDLLDDFAHFAENALYAAQKGDDRPLFIYNFFDRIDYGIDLTEYFDTLTALGRQVFVEVVKNYPDEKMTHPSVQVVKMVS